MRNEVYLEALQTVQSLNLQVFNTTPLYDEITMKEESIKRQLEELQLIKCSLLPAEHLIFLEGSESWSTASEKYDEDPLGKFGSLESPPSIAVSVDGANIWFAVHLADEDSTSLPHSKLSLSVKGEDISRDDQERWKNLVAEKLEEISDSEFPAYQLISLYLLPLLHEEVQSDLQVQMAERESTDASQSIEHECFHVLFTSHHLMSPTKRRLLQQWSSSLSLSGFAKVGYPGVIYAQGERRNIEEFVDNVKAMQWLALKVRFVEPLPAQESNEELVPATRAWKEFQKVGEVVEEMRRIGREEYVVEMGIGSAGVNLK